MPASSCHGNWNTIPLCSAVRSVLTFYPAAAWFLKRSCPELFNYLIFEHMCVSVHSFMILFTFGRVLTMMSLQTKRRRKELNVSWAPTVCQTLWKPTYRGRISFTLQWKPVGRGKQFVLPSKVTQVVKGKTRVGIQAIVTPDNTAITWDASIFVKSHCFFLVIKIIPVHCKHREVQRKWRTVWTPTSHNNQCFYYLSEHFSLQNRILSFRILFISYFKLYI